MRQDSFNYIPEVYQFYEQGCDNEDVNMRKEKDNRSDNKAYLSVEL
jgi:hypothetical protein